MVNTIVHINVTRNIYIINLYINVYRCSRNSCIFIIKFYLFELIYTLRIYLEEKCKIKWKIRVVNTTINDR